MRVIGGEFRSRRLKTLPGQDVRPTPDRLRETLFDVLAPRIRGCVFVDAYAGSGAVGIEALSRGAKKTLFVERRSRAAGLIRENLKALSLEGRAEVFCGKATTVLARQPAESISDGICFLDPPYILEQEYEFAMEILGEKRPALVIAQHASRFQLKEGYGNLRQARVLKQGDNSLSFYELT